MNIESRYDHGPGRRREIKGDAGEQVLESLGSIAPDCARDLIDFPFVDINSWPNPDLKIRETAMLATLNGLTMAKEVFAQGDAQ